MLDRLETIRTETLAALDGVTSSEALRALYNQTVGKRGEITTILRSIGSLDPAERPAVGKRANEVRQELEAAFAEREELIKSRELAQSLEEGALDVTLPGRPIVMGRLHPATQTLRQIYAIWADMGFQVYRSRDVEETR